MSKVHIYQEFNSRDEAVAYVERTLQLYPTFPYETDLSIKRVERPPLNKYAVTGSRYASAD